MGVDRNVDPRDSGELGSSAPLAPAKPAAPAPGSLAGINQSFQTGSDWEIAKQLGTGAENLYEQAYQKAIPYLGPAVGMAAGPGFQVLSHPIQSLTHPSQMFTPQTVQRAGRELVPATIPQAARDAFIAFAPFDSGLAGAAGRVGLMTAGSGVVGALTGKDPGTEAQKGFWQSAPWEGLGYVGGKVGDWLVNKGAYKLGMDTMSKLGTWLQNKFPFIKDLATSGDYERNFQFGDRSTAITEASRNLERDKGVISRSLGPNDRFLIRKPNPLHDVPEIPNPNYGKPIRNPNHNPAQQPTMPNPNAGVPGQPPSMPNPFYQQPMIPDPNRTIPNPTFGKAEVQEWATFNEMDRILSDLNQYGYDTRKGIPRSGVNQQYARALSHSNRDAAIYRLNQLQKGMGDLYSKTRRNFDAANVLTDMFSEGGKNLFDERGIMRPQEMVNLIKKYSDHLGRSLTQAEMQELVRIMRHGELDQIYDQMGKQGYWHSRVHVPLPHVALPVSVGYTPGQPFRPSGSDLPFSMQLGQWARPGIRAAQLYRAQLGQDIPERQAPAGAGAGTPGPSADVPGVEGTAYAAELPPPVPGVAYPVELPPEERRPKAMSDIESLQNRELAPTPSGAERAGEITRNLRKPKRAPEDVTRDLNQGRLSSDEIKKLLLRSSSSDPGARVAGIPLGELMSAAETGTPGEKQILVPLIQARLTKELPKLGNKTMQAKLAQRFQSLQRSSQPY